MPIDQLARDSIVYSAGVGEDVSFDVALIDRLGCSVWAFDPTPRAIGYAAAMKQPGFHFLPYALWSANGVMPFFPPRDPRHVSHSLVNLQHTPGAPIEVECRSVASVMRELGHDRIDLLKLDIEGAEYEVLRSLGEIRPQVMCVELHLAMDVTSIVSFMRTLPYDVARVDGWNFTLVAYE